MGVRAGEAREAAAPPQILGNWNFLGNKRKFGQSQFLKTFPRFFYYFEEINIFYIIQLHSHETVIAYHVMSFSLLGKGIISWFIQGVSKVCPDCKLYFAQSI